MAKMTSMAKNHGVSALRRILCLAAALGMPLGALSVDEPGPPRPEHPRPDLEREPWQSLNGGWLFRADLEDRGLVEEWFRGYDVRDYAGIVVPFPWQSAASSLRLDYQGAAWYRKIFPSPDWPGLRILAVFGAVEGEARLWLNGEELRGRGGGYTPIEFDLTGLLRAGADNDLVLRVVDRDDPEAPQGLQRRHAQVSGIWQSVYLEGRPAAAIRRLSAACRPRQGLVELTAEIERTGPAREGLLRATSPEGRFPSVERRAALAGAVETLSLRLTVPDPVPWSPDRPEIYALEVSWRFLDAGAGEPGDRVRSYFGLREVVVAPGGGGILLNGEPLFLRGATHAGYHPETLYSWPSDDAIRGDVEALRALGLNAVRLSRKIEDPRFLYWCDRLGVAVFQGLPDFARFSERSRRLWESQLREALARDAMHPALFGWTLFEESSGLAAGGFDREKREWVRSMAALARSLDPGRLVIDNAAAPRDHVDTDVLDWPWTAVESAVARAGLDTIARGAAKGSREFFLGGGSSAGQPVVLDPLSPFALGDGDRDAAFGLFRLLRLLPGGPPHAGFFHARFADVEWDHRGLLNYDRSPKQFGFDELAPGMALGDLAPPHAIVIGDAPILDVRPGAALRLPVAGAPLKAGEARAGLILELRLIGFDREGEAVDRGLLEVRDLETRVASRSLGPIEVALPDGLAFAGAISAALRSAPDGEPLARGLLPAIARGGPSPRVEILGDRRIVKLRFQPREYAATNFLPVRDRRPSLLRVPGEAAIEYLLEIPELIPLASIRRLGFEAELAAAGGGARLDWPERRRTGEHPQTDARKSPSTVAVEIAGRRAGEAELADAPADLRGVISFAEGFPHGLHGALVRVWAEGAAPAERLVSIRLRVAPGGHGLAVFGERMGRFLLDPALVVELASPLAAPAEAEAPSAARRVFTRAVSPVIATAEDAAQGGAAWRFTRHPPGDEWAAPAFDDRGWAQGRAAFAAALPSSAKGTLWPGGEIWLRGRFALASSQAGRPLFLRLRHGDAIEVFINGIEAFRDGGAMAGYETLPLGEAVQAIVRPGENSVAVHAAHFGADAFLDLGVLVGANGAAVESR
jgi:hypothetical protein